MASSILAVGDLVFQSLLDDLDLNPVREKWRGYFFAASVVCTLIPFYLTINGLSVNCVPEHSAWNDSASVTLTLPQTMYINSACSADDKVGLPTMLMRYCGAAMLLMTVVVLLVSSYWLHLGHVADCLRTFKRARDKVYDLVLSREKMKALCSNILHPQQEESEAYIKIKEAALLLSFHRKNDDVLNSYRLRCILLGSTQGVCIIISSRLSWVLWEYRNKSFACRLNDTSVNLDVGEGDVASYVCRANEATMLGLFVTTFALTLFLQLIAILYGCCRNRFLRECKLKQCLPCLPCLKCKEAQQTDTKSKHIQWYKTLSLMILFDDSAHPYKSGALKDVVQHLYAAKLAFLDERNLGGAIDSGKFSQVEKYSEIFGQLPEMILLIQDRFQTHRDEESLKKYIAAMRKTQYSIDHDDIVKFVKELSDGRYWEMLINLLEYSDLKESSASMRKADETLELPNAASQAKSSVGGRHSILYYAFEKPDSENRVHLEAAKLLCKGKGLSDLQVTTGISNEGESNPKTLQSHLENIYGTRAREIIKEMGWVTSNESADLPQSGQESQPTGDRSTPRSERQGEQSHPSEDSTPLLGEDSNAYEGTSNTYAETPL